MAISKNIRVTDYGKYRFTYGTKGSPNYINKAFDTLKEAENFRDNYIKNIPSKITAEEKLNIKKYEEVKGKGSYDKANPQTQFRIRQGNIASVFKEPFYLKKNISKILKEPDFIEKFKILYDQGIGKERIEKEIDDPRFKKFFPDNDKYFRFLKFAKDNLGFTKPLSKNQNPLYIARLQAIANRPEFAEFNKKDLHTKPGPDGKPPLTKKEAEQVVAQRDYRFSNLDESIQKARDKRRDRTKEISSESIEKELRAPRDTGLNLSHAGYKFSPVGLHNLMYAEGSKNRRMTKTFEDKLFKEMDKFFEIYNNPESSAEIKRNAAAEYLKNDRALRKKYPEYAKLKTRLSFKNTGLTPEGFMVKEKLLDPSMALSDEPGTLLKGETATTERGKKILKLAKKPGKVGLAAAGALALTGAASADEPPIKYNDELGAFVDPLNDEKVSQATMLDWAANNPMPTAAVASTPLLSKTVRKNTGKLLSGLLKTLGSPTAAAGFAGLTIKENLEEGKSIPDAVIDPLVGAELLFPELAKRTTTSPTGTGLLSKAGRFLLNPIPRAAAAMTPVGLGITGLGIGKELYNVAQEEQDRINEMRENDPIAYQEYLAEQQELMDVSA